MSPKPKSNQDVKILKYDRKCKGCCLLCLKVSYGMVTKPKSCSICKKVFCSKFLCLKHEQVCGKPNYKDISTQMVL